MTTINITLNLDDAEHKLLRGFFGSVSLHRLERMAEVHRNRNGLPVSKADERASQQCVDLQPLLFKIYRQL